MAGVIPFDIRGFLFWGVWSRLPSGEVFVKLEAGCADGVELIARGLVGRDERRAIPLGG